MLMRAHIEKQEASKLVDLNFYYESITVGVIIAIVVTNRRIFNSVLIRRATVLLQFIGRLVAVGGDCKAANMSYCSDSVLRVSIQLLLPYLRYPSPFLCACIAVTSMLTRLLSCLSTSRLFSKTKDRQQLQHPISRRFSTIASKWFKWVDIGFESWGKCAVGSARLELELGIAALTSSVTPHSKMCQLRLHSGFHKDTIQIQSFSRWYDTSNLSVQTSHNKSYPKLSIPWCKSTKPTSQSPFDLLLIGCPQLCRMAIQRTPIRDAFNHVRYRLVLVSDF